MGYKIIKDRKTGEDKKTKLPKGVSYLKREQKYRARYTDINGKRQQKTFKAQKDAERWLQIHRDGPVVVDFTPVRESTLDEWFAFWRDHVSKNRRENTMRNYRERFKRNISPVMDKKPLMKISSFDCQEVINKMERVPYNKKGDLYSQGTVGLAYKTMQVIFKAAVDKKLIKESPLSGVEMEKHLKKERDEMKFLTLDEHRKFLVAAEKSSNFLQFQLMLETGMRPGELIGLTFDDIDWERKTLTIRRTVWYAKGWHVGPQKTMSSYRTIPLTKKAIAILEEANKNKKKINISPAANQSLYYWDPHSGGEEKLVLRDLIFFSKKSGMPMRNNAYDSNIKNLCRRIGIKEISMHDLRHTYATRCIERNVQPKSLQKLLGHSSLKVTMDLYVHVTDESLQNAVDVFETNSNL